MVGDQHDDGPTPTARTASEPGVQLAPDAVGLIRAQLPAIAELTVDAIIDEVPSYADALSGSMGRTISNAVQLALGGFLSLAGGRRGVGDPGTPTAPAVEGAYQLGRGEARAGRTTEALLAAYRIGARTAWREMATSAVRSGIGADTVAAFAELVFAYIDELSAASVAGHADEQSTTGRARERRLERVAHHLLAGSPVETVQDHAERAEWPLPATLTAVIVPEAHVRAVLGEAPAGTLRAADPGGLDEHALLLVPDVHDHRRASLLRTIEGRGAVAGPARTWSDVRSSYQRALRSLRLGLVGDTETHLVDLVLTADPVALDDLTRQVLAPLDDLRPTAAEKLTETLRAWVRHHGRRDDMAAALFVHPQTVRYRMGQLREVFGERLDDPTTVVALTLALGSGDRQPGEGP